MSAAVLVEGPSVHANVLTEMYERLNTRLLAEQIPQVSYDVWSWRMARAIQNRTAGNSIR
jgi:hypothetical protein